MLTHRAGLLRFRGCLVATNLERLWPQSKTVGEVFVATTRMAGTLQVVATKHYPSRMSADGAEELTAKVRVMKSEWEQFGEAARTVHPEGRSPRSRVLRDFMRWYMRQPGAKQPDRPDTGPWSTPVGPAPK